LGERSGAPSGLRPSSFVMCNTPVEVQFTSAGCLNYPCRTPKADTLLRKAGLSPLQIDHSELRIPVRCQIKFVDLAARALSDELLGFHLAKTAELREIGLLYYVMASSELLGDALQSCARYSAISNEGVVFHIVLIEMPG
jgi:hypothetical protein